MNISEKLDLLKDISVDDTVLDTVLGKLLETTLSDYKIRQARYAQALAAFEKRYDMNSKTFHRRFEAGELGDAMDFFEWAGLFEMQQDLKRKIQRLEHAL